MGAITTGELDQFLKCNVQRLFPMSNQTKIVPYIADMAREKNYLLMRFTETHLNCEILDKVVSIDRADSKDRSHGGVALYV